jgi:hypothetical protein
VGPGGCLEPVALVLVSRLPRLLIQPSQIPKISRRTRAPLTNSLFPVNFRRVTNVARAGVRVRPGFRLLRATHDSWCRPQ